MFQRELEDSISKHDIFNPFCTDYYNDVGNIYYKSLLVLKTQFFQLSLNKSPAFTLHIFQMYYMNIIV